MLASYLMPHNMLQNKLASAMHNKKTPFMLRKNK